jgi:hypothetical protein
MKSTFLTLLALAAIPGVAGSLHAQDNVYPLTLVDQAGTPRPLFFEAATGEDAAHYDDESAYLALDPATPSGSYYVHVTDQLNGVMDQVLSLNNPLDRFVTVTNMGGGVILLSVPNNPTLVMGAGLNGLGDSLPLGAFAEDVENPCLYKAWLGDLWNEPVNPNNPYLLREGSVRSYAYFRIGEGVGSTISGIVFDDLDNDGAQDLGEPGLAGVEVNLNGANGNFSTTSAADGSYAFLGVGAGEYVVSQVVLPGRTATTPSAAAVVVCGCGLAPGADFGQNLEVQNENKDGHTIGFWRNKHGVALVESHGLLALLGSLNVVNASGADFTTSSISAYKSWLQGANATNMAYMLSAQLVAMYFNVQVGFVGTGAMIDDPNLGQVTIGSVINAAIASLAAHPYTPTGHAQRAYQEQLKNALDKANNNANWL